MLTCRAEVKRRDEGNSNPSQRCLRRAYPVLVLIVLSDVVNVKRWICVLVILQEPASSSESHAFRAHTPSSYSCSLPVKSTPSVLVGLCCLLVCRACCTSAFAIVSGDFRWLDGELGGHDGHISYAGHGHHHYTGELERRRCVGSE
jgi:hypothetical protein